MAITFPTDPELGQEYLPDNGVTYLWTGSYWSSAAPTAAGKSKYTAVGGDAFTVFDDVFTNEIDGGGADNFGPGPGPFPPTFNWRRDKPDSRDHIWNLQAVRIPTSIDLRGYATPVENQGQLGSCTGNAIAEAIELVDRKNNKNLEISRLFIYYQERLLEGTINIDNGAYIRDGIKACYTWGAPVESLWPYNINKFKTRPSAQAYADAARRKVTGYKRCADFTAVKNALASGFPVIVGFDVYNSFYNIGSNGIMSYPNVNSEPYLGGHAVCIVGYNDNYGGITGNGRFICKNSWGSSWGNGGYFYMPYQVIQNTSMSSDFWVINGVTNP